MVKKNTKKISGNYKSDLIERNRKGVFYILVIFFLLTGVLVADAQCPVAKLAGPKILCTGSTAVLSAALSTPGSGTIASYKWIWNGGEIPGANDSTLTISEDGNYKVIVTNSNNCSTTSANLPVASATPSRPVITGDNFVCGSGSTLLNAAFSANFGPTTYQWQLNGNNIHNEIKTSLYTGITGVYTVVATNFLGCVKTSDPVTVSQKPSGSISISGPSGYCSGTQVTLQANPSLSAGATVGTYLWLFDGSIIGGATSSSYNPNQAGNYKLIVSLSNGCKLASPDFSLSRWTSPTVTVDGTPAYCLGATAQVAANIAGGTAPFTYQWYSNGSPISGSTNSNYFINNTAMFSVGITDANGCAAQSSSVQGEECILPKVKITGTNVFCNTDFVTLTAGVSVNSDAGPPLNYTWYFNGEEVFGETNDNIAVSAIGDYKAAVMFACGCVENSPGFRITSSRPSAIITGSASFCSSSGGTSLSATSSSGLNGATIVSYQWKRNGVIITGANASTLQITDGGNYEVIVTDSNSCTANSAIFSVQKDPC
jgi:hypothetical protein